jgi:hypothetical protein
VHLRFEPQVAVADWWTGSAEPLAQLCSFGPNGYARYARLFHSIGLGAEVRREDLVNVEGNLNSELLHRLAAHLQRHTTTPDDCFFGLWDGFGDIHGSPSVGVFGWQRPTHRQMNRHSRSHRHSHQTS